MFDIIELMEDLELDKEKLDIKKLYKLVEDVYNSSEQWKYSAKISLK